jgi:deoxyribodipyrimidine photo-lyase
MGYFIPKECMPVSIWWIRRDLRLEDNPALALASQAGSVIPVFILDDHLLTKNAPRRQNFLFQGLKSLDQDLRRAGSRLIVRRGDPPEQFTRLVAETHADFIFAGEDYTPYARRRDAKVSEQLPLRLVPGLSLHPPAAVLKNDGTPYTVFTPFKRKWMTLPLSWQSIPAQSVIWHPATALESLSIPELVGDDHFPAGEAEARMRLKRFVRENMEGYSLNRDLMAMNGTSLLSPYLHLGMISPAKVFAAVFEGIEQAASANAKASAETWLSELIWREFYISILFHFPNVAREAFRPALRSMQWNEPGNEFAAWQAGLTGYPIVDAGMRQLTQTGWMHNRARMITASFLVKDLLINWQLGEQWFMEHLIDGDTASNNGGWQWVAGTGTDAAPYFRIFNPVIQSQRFDPDGIFIRSWVPELSNVPTEFIHAPWKMPNSLQIKTGCRIGLNYPAPIVDHEDVKLRAMRTYQRCRVNNI